MLYKYNGILREFDYGFLDLEKQEIRLDDDKYDDNLINLLLEVYPVISPIQRKYKAKSEKEIAKEEQSIICPVDKELVRLTKYHEMIVSLRCILYKEIELSNYDLNTEDRDVTSELDEWIIRFIAHVFIHISTEWWSDGLVSIELIQLKDRLTQSGYYNNQVHKLLAIIDEYSEMLDYSEQAYLRLLIDLITELKNVSILRNANNVWVRFLLCLYAYVLDGNDNSEYYLFRMPREVLVKEYERIDMRLKCYQRENMGYLVFFQDASVPFEHFKNMDPVRKLFEVLSKNEELREKYLQATFKTHRGITRKREQCYAAMYNHKSGKKYAALSGGVLSRTSDYSKCVKLLRRILINEYEVVDDNKIAYYLPLEYYIEKITADEFDRLADEKDKGKGRRMFSCSERKLSTRFEDGKIDMYSKWPPCKMCERMLEEEGQLVKVIFPGKKGDRILDLSIFDSLALEIVGKREKRQKGTK